MRLTAEQRAHRQLSEVEWRTQVDDLASILGYDWMHVDPLRTSGGIWRTPTHGSLGKGWVDTIYVSARRGRVIFVEFKRELGDTSDDQDRVLRVLRAAGQEAYVWRPSDLERVMEVLR